VGVAIQHAIAVGRQHRDVPSARWTTARVCARTALGIGGHEVFAVATPNARGSAARRDNLAAVVRADDGDAVSAFDVSQRAARTLLERLAGRLFDQVRELSVSVSVAN